MPAAAYPTLTRLEVMRRAAEVRESYFKSDDASIEIIRLVKNLRGTVNIASGVDETLHINSDKTFVINLPRNTSSSRDVFTIAHELGHFFLHTDMSTAGTARFNRKGSNRSETEANWFAAELLMPKEQFTKIATKNNFDPKRIAAHFGVSGAAVRVRMSVLGLSDTERC